MQIHVHEYSQSWRQGSAASLCKATEPHIHVYIHMHMAGFYLLGWRGGKLPPPKNFVTDRGIKEVTSDMQTPLNILGDIPQTPHIMSTSVVS